MEGAKVYEVMNRPANRVYGVVVVTALAAALLLWTARPAWAEETLSVSPTHGQATASFTMIYSTTPIPADCEQHTAVFFWGTTNYGSTNFQRTEGSSPSCRASFKAIPPSNDNGVGKHKVDAVHNDAQSARAGTAATEYTIDPPPSPSPSPKPSASPTKQTSAPGGSARATTPAAPSPSPTVSASPSPTPLTTAAASKKGVSGLLIGLIAGAMVLAGLGTFLIARRRSQAAAASEDKG